jgi:hypothetical protein
MGWTDYINPIDDLKKLYEWGYGEPAKQQKAALTWAGDKAAQNGLDERNYNTKQGQTALSYYSGPQAPTGPRPTAPDPSARGRLGGGNNSATDASHLQQLQAAWDKQQAAYQAAKSGPVSPDQALINEANNRPTQQQDYFTYMQGQAAGKTNEETLYDQRKNGNDPAAQYEDTRATEGINKQLAARGRYNSGAGVRQISDYLANANAQRSHDLGTLAAGADSSRATLNTGYGNAASGASGEESKYFGDLSKNSLSLANAKADTFGHYSDRGDDAYQQGKDRELDSKLAAMGVDAATRKQLISDGGDAVDAYIKANGGGGGK